MSFTIDLNGGAPWGFGITGGVDRNQPLTVSKVRVFKTNFSRNKKTCFYD